MIFMLYALFNALKSGMKEKENAFWKTVLAEADKGTGIVHIEKLGSLESWDLFQQMVLYSEVDALCDSTRSRFPFQTWGQGNTACLISWLDENRAAALFFDCELSGMAFAKWVRELDQKVRMLYRSAE